jgi:hypothetical protein
LKIASVSKGCNVLKSNKSAEISELFDKVSKSNVTAAPNAIIVTFLLLLKQPYLLAKYNSLPVHLDTRYDIIVYVQRKAPFK